MWEHLQMHAQNEYRFVVQDHFFTGTYEDGYED